MKAAIFKEIKVLIVLMCKRQEKITKVLRSSVS